MKNLFRAMLCAAALVAATAPAAHAQQNGTAATAADSLFNDLGGKPGIRKIVDDMLVGVMANARIKEFFKDADMERLANLLAEQFCDLSGGPCKYSGETMKESHAGMKLSNTHFNALAEDLQTAMIKNGVSSRAQNRLLAKLAPMQRDIVTR